MEQRKSKQWNEVDGKGRKVIVVDDGFHFQLFDQDAGVDSPPISDKRVDLYALAAEHGIESKKCTPPEKTAAPKTGPKKEKTVGAAKAEDGEQYTVTFDGCHHRLYDVNKKLVGEPKVKRSDLFIGMTLIAEKGAEGAVVSDVQSGAVAQEKPEGNPERRPQGVAINPEPGQTLPAAGVPGRIPERANPAGDPRNN